MVINRDFLTLPMFIRDIRNDLTMYFHCLVQCRKVFVHNLGLMLFHMAPTHVVYPARSMC